MAASEARVLDEVVVELTCRSRKPSKLGCFKGQEDAGLRKVRYWVTKQQDHQTLIRVGNDANPCGNAIAVEWL